MKQETRIVVVLVVALVVAGAALWYAAGWFADKKSERPYYASIMSDLRELAAGEAAYYRTHLIYTTEIESIRTPATGIAGVKLQVLAADADGFIAEGRHEYRPDGRCVIAVGHFAGDSLKSGEPECYWE